MILLLPPKLHNLCPMKGISKYQLPPFSLTARGVPGVSGTDKTGQGISHCCSRPEARAEPRARAISDTVLHTVADPWAHPARKEVVEREGGSGGHEAGRKPREIKVPPYFPIPPILLHPEVTTLTSPSLLIYFYKAGNQVRN